MQNPFLQALANRSFFFLWLSEIFSQIAMNMMNFILILVAFSITNSNTAVSGIVLSFTIPAVLFGLIAGVFVDRWNKKKVLIVTNLLRFLLLLLLVAFHNNLAMLYAITFVVSIVTQFFIPAETPIIPVIVKKHLLLSANALFGFALYGSILIAYALSGPFLLLFGSTNAFFLLAIFFLLSSGFIFLVREPKSEKPVSKNILITKSIKEEIKNAISTIIKIGDVSHAFSLLIVAQILIMVISVLGPGFATHILGIKVEQFPIVFVTPAAIGMAVGAILVTNFLHRFSRHKSATLGLFVSAFAFFLMPFGSRVASRDFIHVLNFYLPHFLQVNILHIMVVLAFILGMSNALIFVPSNTLIQEQTSDEMRGKIYGALNSSASLLAILPVVLVGSLADVFGVGTVLIILGIIVSCLGVVRLFIT
jgi:MFS family permease